MNQRGIRLFVSAIVIFLVVAVAVAYGITPLVGSSLDADEVSSDTTPIAWVNEKPIYRSALEGLALSIYDQTGLQIEDAYQEAFNLLVQNTLIQELAAQDGIMTNDQEVEERVRSLLESAKENPSLQAVYAAQAQQLGTAWDSAQNSRLF